MRPLTPGHWGLRRVPMPLRVRLRRCVSRSMRWATGLSAWAVLVHVATGNPKVRRLGISLAEEVAATLAAGLLIGVLVALIQPRLTTRLRAFAAGSLILTPITAVMWMILLPGLPLQFNLLASILFGVLVGGSYGALLWDM